MLEGPRSQLRVRLRASPCVTRACARVCSHAERASHPGSSVARNHPCPAWAPGPPSRADAHGGLRDCFLPRQLGRRGEGRAGLVAAWTLAVEPPARGGGGGRRAGGVCAPGLRVQADRVLHPRLPVPEAGPLHVEEAAPETRAGHFAAPLPAWPRGVPPPRPARFPLPAPVWVITSRPCSFRRRTRGG